MLNTTGHFDFIMKITYSKILLSGLICLSLFNCSNSMRKYGSVTDLNCDSLNNKKVVYALAKSILEKGDNRKIWSVVDVDTNDMLIVEDYFTNSSTKSKLLLVRGHVGSSTDSANYLLMLVNCSGAPEVVWAEQVLQFYQESIIDLDGDGIKEILISIEERKGGACNSVYSVFNFKNDKKNVLYERQSRSLVDCGYDDLITIYTIGDTLRNTYNISHLREQGRTCRIRQVHTIKIHNGGKTSSEILKNLKTVNDTSYVNLCL